MPKRIAPLLPKSGLRAVPTVQPSWGAGFATSAQSPVQQSHARRSPSKLLSLVLASFAFGLVSTQALAQSSGPLDPADFRIKSDIEQPLPVVGGALETGSSDVGDYLGAMIARDARDLRTASTLLAPLVERHPERMDLVAMLHDFLAAEGLYDEAAPLARRLVDERDEEDEEARRTLYYVALKTGDYEQAVEHAEVWQDRGLGSILRPFALAWAQVGDGDSAGAQEALAPAMEDNNSGDFATALSAIALWIAGEREAALQRYLDYIDEANTSVSLRDAELALLAFGEAGSDEQQQALIDALNPDLLELSTLKRLVEAQAAGETLTFPITTPQQAAAEVLERLASHFSQDELGSEVALGLAGAALFLQPENAKARLVRGEIYADRGLYDYAIQDYTQVQGSDNEVYAADFDRAQALRNLERNEEAFALLEDLAERDVERWRALELKADYLRADKRSQEAVDTYARAEERMLKLGEPAAQQWRFYYAWGIAYDQLDNWPEAEAKFQKSLDLDPDQPNVLNYLAYSWVDRGFEDKFEDALAKLEKAVDARPNSGFIVDSLAWVLFKLGKFEEALGHMERAVELMPSDPVLNDHLGDVYWVNGRFAEAKFQWRRSLSFEPAEKDRARIELKLEIGLDRVEAQEAAEAAENGSSGADSGGAENGGS